MSFARFPLLLVLGFFASLLTRADGRAQTTLSPNRVTFYTEPNFRGEALTVEAGANLDTLDRVKRSDQRPWTFAISSIRVEGAASAKIYSAPGFRGDSLEVSASMPDLYAATRGADGGATWDRCIVSLAVTGPQVISAPPPRTNAGPTTVYVVPAPPPPSPPRPPPPPYTTRSAEVLIQRAYRDVLVRPADPAGVRHYREKLMREGWSERQLITDLQRSEEARSIKPEDAIARAYREVLGREPDPSGLASYRNKWRDGWTQGQIREDLRRSKEGRDREVRDVITRAYRDLLGREPDPAGYANYEKMLRRDGGTERDVRASILSSDEYRQRNRSR